MSYSGHKFSHLQYRGFCLQSFSKNTYNHMRAVSGPNIDATSSRNIFSFSDCHLKADLERLLASSMASILQKEVQISNKNGLSLKYGQYLIG